VVITRTTKAASPQALGFGARACYLLSSAIYSAPRIYLPPTVGSPQESGPKAWLRQAQHLVGDVEFLGIFQNGIFESDTAKLNNVEPFASLRDVLQRMTDGHPASRLDELLPWNWRPISLKA
jgi:hypothetical protein